MKAHTEIEANSADWQILRSGKVTASEMDALITPFGKVRDGDGVETYLNQKLCERWVGGPVMSLQGVFDVEQGKITEDLAKPAFTIHTGIEIQNVAFIETDDGRAGCSPDGMLPKIDSGVEIKCPRMETHIGYLRTGKLPKQYVAQVQGSMFVSGCATWHFFSYRRSLPPLHVIVERDDNFHAALSVALEDFIEKLDREMKRLEEINGGPPKRLTPLAQPKPQEESLPN